MGKVLPEGEGFFFKKNRFLGDFSRTICFFRESNFFCLGQKRRDGNFFSALWHVLFDWGFGGDFFSVQGVIWKDETLDLWTVV